MSRLVLLRKIVFILMLVALVIALVLLFGTEQGNELRKTPELHAKHMQAWVAMHPYLAPVVFIAGFVTIGVLGFPIWWVQVLGGYGFGLFFGILWSQIGATLSAMSAASVSRFVLADWFHQRVEKHIVRLDKLDRKLGHNGLLVVCMVRLSHFVPAGAANFAMGLTRISIRDVGLGTLIGGIPTSSLFVAFGASKELFYDWRFIAGIATVNILVLGGIVLRYLRPDWFKAVGVE